MLQWKKHQWYCFCLLLLGLGSNQLKAQINTDSIFKKLTSFPTQLQQLNYLDTICNQLEANLTAGADTLFEKRQMLAQQLVPFEEQVPRVIEAASYYNKNYQHQKASTILAPYFQQVDEVKDLMTKSRILNAQAAVFSNQNIFEPAIELYEKIVAMYDSTKADALPPDPDIYRSLGKNLYGNSRFGESSIALNRAKELYLETQDSSGLQFTYLELAILFSQIGLYDDAAFYIKQRQKFIVPASDLNNAFDNINLGRNLILQSRFEEALDLYHESIALGPFDPQFDYLYVYIYNSMVECHYFLATSDSVNFYFLKLEASFEKLGKPPVFDFLYQQSYFLYNLVNNNFVVAEKTGLALYADALKDNDSAEYLMYTQFLSELYRRKGDFQKALNYADLYKQASDSIQTANKANALLLYQTQYETKEKENTIQTLQTDKALQAAKAAAIRNGYFAGTFVLLLLGAVLFMRLYYRNKVQSALQLAQLRSKISSDLHDDVGSILTGLAMQSEILESTTKEADKWPLQRIAEMSRSAMSRMRDAVWAMDAQKDNWQSLLDRMQEFAAETLSLKEISFEFNFRGIEEMQALSGDLRQNLYLVFKEALTNIIKHSNATKVDILLDNSDTTFRMIIQDDGHSIPKEYKTTGLGNENMKNRALKIDGQLSISSHNGFKVSLHRPRI
jgi:signal transduction histidine kinase